MPISNLPESLQGMVQKGFLERKFLSGLEAKLGFRQVADVEQTATGIGETITKTRTGLKPVATTPIPPASNVGLDNGLTPSSWSIEQYTLGINLYGDTQNLNMVTDTVNIAGSFLHNAYVNGEQSARTLDVLARDKLYDGYLGGNSWVTETLAASGVDVKVDDVRRFSEVAHNGTMVPVSPTRTRNVTVGANVYVLTNVAEDAVNTSTLASIGGKSGVLTFSTNVSIADGTLGNGAIAEFGAVVLRPNYKDSTYKLASTDLLTMNMIRNAVTILRNNAVPEINGLYNCYLDSTSMDQLFADEEFQLLYRGNPNDSAYKRGEILSILGVRFISTNNTIQQTLGSVQVHRPVISGQGSLIEGPFAGMNAKVKGLGGGGVVHTRVTKGIVRAIRMPLDRMGQEITQTWYWIGGYGIPTDVTATQAIIPTAADTYYKRAVVIETG